MWYDMKRQFIESAARVMWADVWGHHTEELECIHCDDPANDHKARNKKSGIEPWDGDVLCVGPNCSRSTIHRASHAAEKMNLIGKDLTDIAPPTPQYALLSAAILLGKLEQANGCELAVIIEAARKAECASGSCNEWGAREGGPDRGIHGQYDHGDCAIDVAEFASDIALEALGHGVSWFDDHEHFELPTGNYEFDFEPVPDGSPGDVYVKPRMATRPFVVPRIEFEYDGTEVGR